MSNVEEFCAAWPADEPKPPPVELTQEEFNEFLDVLEAIVDAEDADPDALPSPFSRVVLAMLDMVTAPPTRRRRTRPPKRGRTGRRASLYGTR